MDGPTRKQKLLFVCLQNRLRSPTAEKIFNEHPELEVKSAGLDKASKVPLTKELLEWADIVFVMERRQRNLIQKRFKEIYAKKRIICLYIPGEYEYMDPDLINLLKETTAPYIEK